LPVLIKASTENGNIRSTVTDSELAAIVSAGRIVILKDALAPEMMLDLRREVIRWAKTTEPFPHGPSPSVHGNLNYHRMDDGQIVSSLPHIFHQNCFNDLAGVAGQIGALRVVAELMRDLQNRVAGTKFDFDLAGLRTKVLRYPRGGGYLSEHQHPLEPQRLGLITSLSRLGDDFVKGGTTFRTPFGFVDTNESHNIGDIIIFRYDLIHAVAPVDEEQSIDWNAESGKWSMLLELRSTHGQSTAKV
jgi:hypothetical protein